MSKIVPLSLPDISDNEIKVVSKVLKSGWLAHGEWNKKFESEFSSFIGVKNSISMNSCTSALEIALKVNDIKGEVVIPSMTWCATANAVINAGAKPIFCDVEPDTRNVSANTILPLINKRTEAIIVVHFGGQTCNMEEIVKLSKKYKLLLIEDSAETLGGTWKKKKAGSFGIGCFSFFPTKNITTGEGGMFTCSDNIIANKARALIGHGITNSTFDRERKKYKPWIREASYAGHNFRMPNPLAALGFLQLKKISKMNKKRNTLANYYNKKLSQFDFIKTPICHKDVYHSYQMYTVEVDKKIRNKFVNFLRSKNILASVHFYPPVHLQPFYKNIKNRVNLSITEELSERLVTMPMYSTLKKNQIDYITDTIKNFKSRN